MSDATTPSISIVTWDASFRESYHLIDFVGELDYPRDRLGFFWVEAYDAISPEAQARLDRVPFAEGLTLSSQGEWHVGRCMNAGIRERDAELYILLDGDVVFEPDFAWRCVEAAGRHPGAAVYGRRWDEPPDQHASDWDLDHLKRVCQPKPNWNTGGCAVLSCEVLDRVEGYEEHWLFGGAGAINHELYTRIMASGTPIVWPPELRVYHPWHPGHGPSRDRRERERHP